MSDSLENLRKAMAAQESKKCALSAENASIVHRIESIGLELTREIEERVVLDKLIDDCEMRVLKNNANIKDARSKLNRISQDYTETLILSQSIDAKIASIRAQHDKNLLDSEQFFKDIRGKLNADMHAEVSANKDEYTDFLRRGRP
jgi:hypothetical protein